MTTKPLVFHQQHMCWQQRVEKERGTELRVKDETELFRTFTDKLPQYLERMDRKKQRLFRGAHPTRYQDDMTDIASTVQQVRPRSIAGSRQSRQSSVHVRQILERRSRGSVADDRESRFGASQNIGQLSVKSSGRMMSPEQRVPHFQQTQPKQSLKDFINENTMYEDLLDKVNRQLALKQAIERADNAIAKSKKGSIMGEAPMRGADAASAKSYHRRSNASKSIVGSQIDAASIRQPVNDAASRVTNHTQQSLITISQKAASQARESQRSDVWSKKTLSKAWDRNSRAVPSQSQLRSTAHSLVETLQVQLERERQQKRKLMEHLEQLESGNQFKP